MEIKYRWRVVTTATFRYISSFLLPLFVPPLLPSGSVHLSSSLCDVWFVRADDEFVYEWRELISPEWSLALSFYRSCSFSTFLLISPGNQRNPLFLHPQPRPFLLCRVPCPSDIQIWFQPIGCWRGHWPFQDTKRNTLTIDFPLCEILEMFSHFSQFMPLSKCSVGLIFIFSAAAATTPGLAVNALKPEHSHINRHAAQSKKTLI